MRNDFKQRGREIMSKPTYELARERLGPCGLHCGKCYAYTEGDIPALSRQLAKSLGNFDVYAKRFVELVGEPLFLKYPDFREFLGYLAEGKCKGCRKEKCKLFKTCGVRPCIEMKKVDFCFQCEDFPCDHTGFDEHLYKRYVDINERMKAVGVELYYEEIKDCPRY